MSSAEEAVFHEALALPVQSRACLADMLWESLPEEQLDVSVDAEIGRAWAEEAQRRMQQVEAGKVALVPGADVLARLRRRLQQ
jgi:putative addiction module component (TIGR02574 family)